MKGEERRMVKYVDLKKMNETRLINVDYKREG